LSESHKGESRGSGDKDPRTSQAAAAPAKTDEKNRKKPRTGDLGRALRSVYDDTLRESVPDDFMDLLGKLS
jgi:hypothetical protein